MGTKLDIFKYLLWLFHFKIRFFIQDKIFPPQLSEEEIRKEKELADMGLEDYLENILKEEDL